uniref:Uncharacterized protein n=1 Tax=Opuntia streptacantha TaxID=393608 RepID=A0A7C9AR84_OPUST
MRNWIIRWYAFFSLLILCFDGLCCNGEDEKVAVIAPMKKTEKEALYSAIQGFVGNWWNGSDLYPDPCGWTPIQVYIISSRHLWNKLNELTLFSLRVLSTN